MTSSSAGGTKKNVYNFNRPTHPPNPSYQSLLQSLQMPAIDGRIQFLVPGFH